MSSGFFFKGVIFKGETESSLNRSMTWSKDICEPNQDGMPDPRRSIEIELQWLVSVYSPNILNEIQALLNVKNN